MKTNHFGRPNNGLVAVWPHANDQGAAEMDWQASSHLAEELGDAVALYIAGADPAGDSAALKMAIQRAGFVVVQELYMTETARMPMWFFRHKPRWNGMAAWSRVNGAYSDFTVRSRRWVKVKPILKLPLKLRRRWV